MDYSSIQRVELELPQVVVFYRQRSDYRHRAVAGDPPVVQEPPSRYNSGRSPLLPGPLPPGYGRRYQIIQRDHSFKNVFGRGETKDLMIDVLNSLLEGRNQLNAVHLGSAEKQGKHPETRTASLHLQLNGDGGEQFVIEKHRVNPDNFVRTSHCTLTL